MKFIFKLNRLLSAKQKKSLIVISVLLIVGVLLVMFGLGVMLPLLAIMLSKNIVNDYPLITNFFQKIGNPSQVKIVIVGFSFLILFYFIKLVFTMFLNWKQSKFASNISETLSQKMFTGYLNMPYERHLNRNSSNLIHNITGEVAMFNTVIQGVMILLTEASVIFGVALMLILIEPKGSLIVIFIMTLSAIFFYRVTRKWLVKWGSERQVCDLQISKNLIQSLHGIKDVKILNREQYFINIFDENIKLKSNITTKYNSLLQFPRVYLELLSVIGLTVLVLVMLYQGKPLENIVPTLGVFISAAFRMIPSLNRIMSSTQNIKYAEAVVDTLYYEIEGFKKQNINKKNGYLNFQNEIQLKSINFSYNESTSNVLNDISLKILKGQVVGIIGSSGAGKSTIVDILLGLLTVNEGEVLIDGRSIYENISSWQSRIGYVPQSIYLIDDTIKKNIAFGIPDELIDNKMIYNVLKMSKLYDFVEGVEDGIESIVGDRGVKLSGGQRQRIGIARALYNNPEILVLDEATSALDNNTEAEVIDAINSLKGKLTMIIIAHRLTTVKECDVIYQLEKGKIVKSGSPYEILN